MHTSGQGILLTIGIPNYNYEKYIKNCLGGILSQQGDDFEVLVGDNSSTDMSWEIISSYNDHRLRSVRHSSNLGFHANWNFVLSNARGKYFVLLPSDDFVAPDFIETFRSLYKKCENEDIGTILWGYGNYMEATDITVCPAIPNIEGEYAVRSIGSCAFEYRHFSPPWAHAQLTATLHDIGGYKDGSRRLDSLLFYDALCANKAQKILAIKRPLTFQRIHSLNERYNKHYEILIDNIELAKKVLEIENNLINRMRLNLFLAKNYILMFQTKKNKTNIRIPVKLTFSDYCRIVIYTPFAILITFLGRYLPFWPFSRLDRFINI